MQPFVVLASLVEYTLITRQRNPNKDHGNQSSSLRAEIIPEHVEIIRLLLEHTADLDLNAQERNNMALLHEVVNSRKLDVAEILISYGANLNTLDGQGHEELRIRKYLM